MLLLLRLLACGQLVLFRGRSRHTFGFEPAERFELPRHEFEAVASLETRDPVALEPVDASDALDDRGEATLWRVRGLSDAALARAAARCCLTFGAYRVLGEGADAAAAAAAAADAADARAPLPDAPW